MIINISKLKRYVALVIKFDPQTGARPIPGISPRHTDKALFCLPLWQDLEKGIEMRLILDDRDIEQYRGIEGVEIVEGKVAINEKVKELFKPRYSIEDSELYRISLQDAIAKGIVSLDELKILTRRERLRLLYERGILGIREDRPYLIP